jgi:RNA polymerase sigma-70 factor (ECF subfamily)
MRVPFLTVTQHATRYSGGALTEMKRTQVILLRRSISTQGEAIPFGKEHEASIIKGMIERSNEQWLQALKTTGSFQDRALADLRQVILKGLPYALSSWITRDDPRFEALTEEVAQETLLRVLAHLQTFEGRSKFTTWVHKIATRVALTELRRKRWQNYSLEEMEEDEMGSPQEKWLADASANPARLVEGNNLMTWLQKIMMEELTEKQRQAMTAIALKGVPLEEVARRMGTNRNALYKLMHDTRVKLKHRLAQECLTPEDLLATFERK